VIHLDDFYRDHDDPAVPAHPDLGIPDWDDPRSWDVAAAAAALSQLVSTGTAQVPVYDISSSRALGEQTITCGANDLVVAEGIFAAHVIGPLREAGLLHSAWCITHPPAVTALRRLARDLAERRKPPLVLVRRGWALMRAEPAVVREQVRLGAVQASPSSVEEHLRTARVEAS
jgi:uridine kinase